MRPRQNEGASSTRMVRCRIRRRYVLPWEWVRFLLVHPAGNVSFARTAVASRMCFSIPRRLRFADSIRTGVAPRSLVIVGGTPYMTQT